MKKIKYLVVSAALASTLSCVAQNLTVTYKKVDTTELNCIVYLPDSMKKGKLYPAMIFFLVVVGIRVIFPSSNRMLNIFQKKGSFVFWLITEQKIKITQRLSNL